MPQNKQSLAAAAEASEQVRRAETLARIRPVPTAERHAVTEKDSTRERKRISQPSAAIDEDAEAMANSLIRDLEPDAVDTLRELTSPPGARGLDAEKLFSEESPGHEPPRRHATPSSLAGVDYDDELAAGRLPDESSLFALTEFPGAEPAAAPVEPDQDEEPIEMGAELDVSEWAQEAEVAAASAKVAAVVTAPAKPVEPKRAPPVLQAVPRASAPAAAPAPAVDSRPTPRVDTGASRALPARKPLGELLVESRLITQEQLTTALDRQRRTQQLLGEALVGLGFATEAAIARLVGEQTGTPFADLAHEKPTKEARALLPADFCREHRVLPLGIDDGILRVAMANPASVPTLVELRTRTGMLLAPHIASTGDILRHLENQPAPVEPFDATLRRLVVAAEAGGSPAAVAALVEELVVHALEERATDLHLEPEEATVRVRYRVDGLMLAAPPLPKTVQAAVTTHLKSLAGLDTASQKPQAGRVKMTLRGTRVDVRFATAPCRTGENLVLRFVQAQIPTLDVLGLQPDDRAAFERLLERPHGLLLVAGPHASGRTTTLHAALARLSTLDVNIVSIEDPIERELPLVRQTQVDARAGYDFATALPALLRQEPDVLLIGELDGAESAARLSQAALGGLFVLGSITAPSAAGAVARLGDFGLRPRLVADTVVGVVGQRLVRQACEHCVARVTPPAQRRDELEAAAVREAIEWDGSVAEAQGCENCRFRGYLGRLALFELLEITAAAREVVMRLDGDVHFERELALTGRRTIYEDGLRHVLRGALTLEELDRVIDPDRRLVHG